MKYELIVYLGKDLLIALDVNKNCMQYISIDGNTTCSSDNIEYFYEKLLDYYN